MPLSLDLPRPAHLRKPSNALMARFTSHAQNTGRRARTPLQSRIHFRHALACASNTNQAAVNGCTVTRLPWPRLGPSCGTCDESCSASSLLLSFASTDSVVCAGFGGDSHGLELGCHEGLLPLTAWGSALGFHTPSRCAKHARALVALLRSNHVKLLAYGQYRWRALSMHAVQLLKFPRNEMRLPDVVVPSTAREGSA